MGTRNRKGKVLPNRPHRRAYFVTEPIPAISMALHYMILNTEIPINKQGNKITVPKIECDLRKIENCDFIKWCRKYALAVTEPQWFAMITNLARLEGGPSLIHEISALDMFRYNHKQTQRLIERVVANGYSPTSCKKLIKLGFHCRKLGQCSVKAPTDLTFIHHIQEMIQ